MTLAGQSPECNANRLRGDDIRARSQFPEYFGKDINEVWLSTMPRRYDGRYDLANGRVISGKSRGVSEVQVRPNRVLRALRRQSLATGCCRNARTYCSTACTTRRFSGPGGSRKELCPRPFLLPVRRLPGRRGNRGSGLPAAIQRVGILPSVSRRTTRRVDFGHTSKRQVRSLSRTCT